MGKSARLGATDMDLQFGDLEDITPWNNQIGIVDEDHMSAVSRVQTPSSTTQRSVVSGRMTPNYNNHYKAQRALHMQMDVRTAPTKAIQRHNWDKGALLASAA